MNVSNEPLTHCEVAGIRALRRLWKYHPLKNMAGIPSCFPVLTTTAFAALLALGCSTDRATRGAVEIRDSAGIRIVESGEYPASLHRWTVSDSPLVRIGTVSGDEDYQLFRASDGTILKNGVIAVVNSGSHQLRFYDAAGRFEKAVGGQGDGPGELRAPTRVFRLPGDSLLVVELRRLSWFGPDGIYVRSLPISVVRPQVAFADGSFAGANFAPGQDPFVVGASRPQMAIIRWWPASGDSTILAIVPGDAVYRMNIENNAIVSYDLGFGPRLSLAATGNELFWADGTRFEIQVMGSDGTIRSLYRRRMDLVPVTSEDQRLYQNFLLTSVQSENQRARLNRLFGEWDYPARKPYFDKLEIDPFGNLWIREFTYDARQATTWSILDPHGSWIGDLGLPAGLEVWEIGEDYIFGRMRDANDVEFVVKYALSR